MVILADTSVWIDHLRRKNDHFDSLLNEGVIAVHPFAIGEIACGKLKNRREILTLLQALPEAPVVSQDELLHFIDGRGLSGSGIGFVDAHLLASSELIKAMLWTMDRSLQRAASKLDLSYT